MKFKTISLLGVIVATTLSSGNVYAQKMIALVKKPKHFIVLDSSNAEELNLDLNSLKISLNVQEDDEVFAVVDDEGTIVNLGIYHNDEYASSRVDRDGRN